METAIKKLESALGNLSQAVDSRLERDRKGQSADLQLQKMADDRVRLAEELDLEAAKSAQLEEINRDVSRRLVSAMESIRMVLEQRHG